MAQTGQKVVYEGPPHYENGSLVDGKKFHLSGRPLQAQEGVELARGIAGILLPSREYRYDTSAEQPGSTFVSSITGRRRIDSSINVFGDTIAEFQDNWNDWVNNHPDEVEGKLWFYPEGKKPRYAYVRKNAEAGQSTLDIDPYLFRKIEGLEWGWESDYSYFFGDMVKVTFNSSNQVSFVPEGDVARMYPKLYLPGPGQYTVMGITTPTLASNEVVRLNFDPLRKTYVRRNTATGKVDNLWYTLEGKRPELVLEAGKRFTLTIAGSAGKAYIEYTPLYKGVF